MQELCPTDIEMDADGPKDLHKACSIIEDITAAQYRSVIATADSRPCLQAFFCLTDGQRMFEVASGLVLEICQFGELAG